MLPSVNETESSLRPALLLQRLYWIPLLRHRGEQPALLQGQGLRLALSLAHHLPRMRWEVSNLLANTAHTPSTSYIRGDKGLPFSRTSQQSSQCCLQDPLYPFPFRANDGCLYVFDREQNRRTLQVLLLRLRVSASWSLALRRPRKKS